MDRTLLFATFSVFLFEITQSLRLPLNLVPNSSHLFSDNYAMYAKDFASKSLSGTTFCGSIILPMDNVLLKKSLQAILFNANRNAIDLDDKDRLDSCCRSFHKCEAHKNVELSGRNDSSISYCECVYNFRACLKKLNTSISSDLAFIHSINATKCYAYDHPITKCIELDAYIGSKYLRTVDPTLNDTSFNRCKQYQVDYSQPKNLQLLDLLLIHSVSETIGYDAEAGANATVEGILIPTEKDIISRISELVNQIMVLLKGVSIFIINGISIVNSTNVGNIGYSK